METLKLKCGLSIEIHSLLNGDTKAVDFQQAREYEAKYGIDLRTNNDDDDTWLAFIVTDSAQPNALWLTVFDSVHMYEYDIEVNDDPLQFSREVVKRITPLYFEFDTYREKLEALERLCIQDDLPVEPIPNLTLVLIGIDGGYTCWNNHEDHSQPVWLEVMYPRKHSQIDNEDFKGTLEVYHCGTDSEE